MSMATRLQQIQAGLKSPLDQTPPTGTSADQLNGTQIRRIKNALLGSCGRAGQSDGGCTFARQVAMLNSSVKGGAMTRGRALIVLDGATLAELTGIPSGPLADCCKRKPRTHPL